MMGASRTGVCGGGACHDEKALGGQDTFANGLAKPPSAPEGLLGSLVGAAAKGLSFGRDRLPRPARWRAIFVVSLFKKDIFGLGGCAWDCTSWRIP